MREVRLLLFLCLASIALAQDPFEIHIYEYEPMTRGQYRLEAHLISTRRERARGTERSFPAPERRT